MVMGAEPTVDRQTTTSRADAAAPTRVPLADLGRLHAPLERELTEAFTRVVASSAFILGHEVERFEAQSAAYFGAKHAIGVGSATDALTFSLDALRLSPGAEVITAGNGAWPTVEAIINAGLTPRPVDIDRRTYTMDPAAVRDAINGRTEAILPVHLYGHAADMDPILELASRHRLAVVEDVAQAHGGRYRNRTLGTLADAGALSFFPSKNLGGFGDGGMVITDRDDVARAVRAMRNHGRESRYAHALPGRNSRLAGLQAALLAVKAPHLEKWNEERRVLAARYAEHLAHLPLVLPIEAPSAHHVYHLYVVQAEDRDALRDACRAAGVATEVHYPIPQHRQPAFTARFTPPSNLPEVERTADRLVTLPLFPGMTTREQDAVVATLCRLFGRESRVS